MLPSILAKQLEKGIGDYIETTFPMTNAPFKGSVHNMLETKDSLYHETYVSVRLPFRVAETILWALGQAMLKLVFPVKVSSWQKNWQQSMK